LNRAALWRALVALLVVGLTGFFAVTKDAKLGLDLRGGTQIVLETRDSATTEADAEATDRALEVLRRRVDALGVAEPTLARSGNNRIIIELPGVDDPAAAERAVGRTAQLTMHPVLGPGDPSQLSPEDLEDLEELPEDPTATQSPAADPTTGIGNFVTIDFEGGGRKWEELTGEAACQPSLDPRRRIAIVLDGDVISSPQVQETVQCGVGIQGGTTQITGDFTREEAQQLAVLIKGGALPVPVETISRSFVGPTLGEEAIDASIKAGIIGLSLTALFLIAVYRLMGFLAALALASYGVISYGTLVALGATLTLPGLGGLLLSAGLAIDANVLVFERAREEYAAQKSRRLFPALENGFSKAFSAIADSNITTLLAAALLFFLAAGPVRGFGVTLTIGVISSVVSALLVTRVLAEFAVKRGVVGKRPAITGLASLGRFREWLTRRNPDLMSRSRLWLAISGLAVVIAIAGMFVRGFNFGVEFTGGRVVEYATSQDITVNEARQAVSDAGFPTAVVQEAGDAADPNIAVRTGDLDDDEEQAIASARCSSSPR